MVVEVDLRQRRQSERVAVSPVEKRSTRRREKRRRWLLFDFVERTFLPSGYPRSVSREYFEYQVWDSVQGLCSYVRGVLSTSAMLRAAGVGSASATASGAALTWLARDGVGTLGSLIFSCWIGAHVEGELKRWRLFADVINDVGLSLEVLAPLISSTPNDTSFVVSASLASACKAACGVVASSTKAAISAHLALSPRALADVAAKEAAQETAVTLFGIGLGFLVAFATFPLAIFAVLTAFHVYANWRAVKCLRLKTLNMSRAQIVFEEYCKNNAVLDPSKVSDIEPILTLGKAQGPRAALGARLPPHNSDFRLFERGQSFALFLGKGRDKEMRAVLSRDASPDDALQALFHAISLKYSGRLRFLTADCNETWIKVPTRVEDDSSYSSLRAALAAQGWDLSDPALTIGPFRYDED